MQSSVTPTRVFYFFLFGASACLLPFLTLYYRDAGLSGREIGALTAIVPLITMVASPTWGVIADATRRNQAILILGVAGTATAMFLVQSASSFIALLPLVALYAISIAPIVPIVDNNLMELLGEHKDRYGRIRLWGSIGWGIAGAIVGVLVEGNGLRWAFGSYLVMMGVLLIVSLRLTVRPVSLAVPMRQGMGILLKSRAWLLFLAVALVIGMGLNIFLNYLFLYLETLNASSTVMGLSLTVSTASELPVFFIAPYLLRRWGAPRLLLFSVAMVAVRAFGYTLMTDAWQVLPLSVLHGVTFGTMWAAGVAYANDAAPRGLGASAQGMLGGVIFGLGSAVGAFAGGVLYDAVSPVAPFHLAGWCALLALLPAYWLQRVRTPRQAIAG